MCQTEQFVVLEKNKLGQMNWGKLYKIIFKLFAFLLFADLISSIFLTRQQQQQVYSVLRFCTGVQPQRF